MVLGNNGDNRLECKICKQKKNQDELYMGGTECFDCWEADIDEKQVQELRKGLSQYLDIDKSKIKEGLGSDKLKKVRKIIRDNYIKGSDTIGGVASKEGGKELIKAMWSTGIKFGWQPSECLKELERKIAELSEPKSTSKPIPKLQPKKIQVNCPFCDKEFSCQLETTDPTERRREKEDLNEKKAEHIREIHGEEENNNSNEDSQKIEQNNSDVSQQRTNSSPKSGENKSPWLLIIGIGATILLVVAGTIAFILVKKNRQAPKRTKKS